MKYRTDYEALIVKAHAAGMAAGNAKTPRPMIVGTPKDGLMGSDIDYSKETYHEPEGVCGFAWVKLKGNTGFGRYLKHFKIARSNYPTGLAINVRYFGQSMERKEAYASAFSKVLREAGIEAYSDSRLD